MQASQIVNLTEERDWLAAMNAPTVITFPLQTKAEGIAVGMTFEEMKRGIKRALTYSEHYGRTGME